MLQINQSSHPGFGGQKFIQGSIRKIKEAVQLRKALNANFLIEVDGGIDNVTSKPVLEAGCDVFISGSSIFRADNITAAATELLNIIKNR